ncbi:MAG: hypothetical protein ABIZ34_05580, partial [Candidatus Limnocylindrales bacterium]
MSRRFSVSSPQNPRFRAAMSLRESQERRRQSRIIIDGLREIGIALDAGVRPLEAYVDIDRADAAGVAALVA